MSKILAHDLATVLLRLPNLPVSISVDISTGDDDSTARAFGDEWFGVNSREANPLVLLFCGEANVDLVNPQIAELKQRIAKLEAQTPSALKEKLRSAEQYIAELEAQTPKAPKCKHEWTDLHALIQSEYEPDILHVNRKCILCGDVIGAQIPKAPEVKS